VLQWTEGIKPKRRDNVTTTVQEYNNREVKNLTDDEMKGLKELGKDKSIVIMKADKGNCTVLLRKADYINELVGMLGDETKFRMLDDDPTIKREEKLVRHLLYLKKQNSITEMFYDKVRPHGSAPARLYGLPKVHKANHPLRPICSSLKSYNCRRVVQDPVPFRNKYLHSEEHFLIC